MTEPGREWTPGELRAYVAERSGRRCEWPNGTGGTCGDPMEELAHIRSRGMGGGASRNQPGNAFAACRDHARVSDLQPPPNGTAADMYRELRNVPGCDEIAPGDRIGSAMVSGMQTWIEQRM